MRQKEIFIAPRLEARIIVRVMIIPEVFLGTKMGNLAGVAQW